MSKPIPCGGDDGKTATTASTATTAADAGATTSAPPPTGAASSSTQAPPASTATSGAPTASTNPGPTTQPAQAVTFGGQAGQLFGAYATPASPKPKGAVLLIHENRGLTAHFKALPNRFAAAGYAALAVDLASRKGGTDAIGDEGQVTAALGAIPADQLVADMRSALDELAKRAPGSKLGIVGFCFGGGQVWSLLAAGEPRLAAAAPFYGPGIANPDFLGSKAAVLGVYAELDSRVDATKDAMDSALTKSGLVHEMRVFPGVDHAFFNDTGARYNATQAQAAFDAVLAWFAKYL
ncbi:MAG: dienelactone hydrolase family protein [Alphaproteobacteria bacterium]